MVDTQRLKYTKLTMTTINSPPYLAYALKRDGRVGRWVEVGIATVHKDGKGFDVMLDRLPVAGFNGHIVVRARDADPISPEDLYQSAATNR